MMLKRLIPAVACAVMLVACASPGEGGSAAKPATVAAAVAEADAAVAAGQRDKAFALLKTASLAFPTEKTPLVRMAQMRFDANDYGEAIVHAQDALARDPDDLLANSIAAVSGLRVTSKALGELTRKSKLNGDVKSEAESLAKLLRTSLGEDVLVPNKAKPTPKPTPKTPASNTSRTASSSSSDPFGALK
ncbi:hypothetical protein [Massilia brevitalea]|uniref:hypothetical protein n=1 Tax=Massilia brevitalea TaxID=442526 RepID=UPI002739C53E|nr:hypothetical protein [Massilia brevitalea]